MDKQNAELVTAKAEAVQPKVEEINKLKAENAKLKDNYDTTIKIIKSHADTIVKLKARVKELEEEVSSLEDDLECM